MFNPRLRESLSGVLMHFFKDRAGPPFLHSAATNLKWHTQSRRRVGAVVARSAGVTNGFSDNKQNFFALGYLSHR